MALHSSSCLSSLSISAASSTTGVSWLNWLDNLSSFQVNCIITTKTVLHGFQWNTAGTTSSRQSQLGCVFGNKAINCWFKHVKMESGNAYLFQNNISKPSRCENNLVWSCCRICKSSSGVLQEIYFKMIAVILFIWFNRSYPKSCLCWNCAYQGRPGGSCAARPWPTPWMHSLAF